MWWSGGEETKKRYETRVTVVTSIVPLFGLSEKRILDFNIWRFRPCGRSVDLLGVNIRARQLPLCTP